MRNLIFLLLLISCSKESIRGLSVPEKNENSLQTLENFEAYSEKIDVMVAFLWPVEVKEESQRKAIRAVIGFSRELKDYQEDYLSEKLKLKRAYEKELCDCVLNDFCENEEVPEDSGECIEIEDKIFVNERKLPEIYGIVEKMENNVLLAGGEWIKTHNDFTELPVSTFSFKTLMLNMTVFGTYIKEEVEIPYEYMDVKSVLIQERTFKRLNVRFTDQVMGEWEFDLSLRQNDHSLVFQGDLYLHLTGSKRQGVVYWTHPAL